MSTAFHRDLIRYGPTAHTGPMSLARARAYCAQLTRRHYENFSVVSVLLPRRLVPHFQAVYAYCRWADDLADEAGGGVAALSLLRWWRDELLACHDGRPRHPVMVALLETIRRFDIPAGPFLDLLSAFEQDQLLKRYATFTQLLDYCRRSANPVGRLVLYLSEAHTPENVALSDHVCTALQLANFWQDVARDFAIGRVYLPEEDRDHFGYTVGDLEARRFTPEFARLMRFQVERARDLFYRGFPLLDRVPTDVGLDVELFLRGGLAILRKIERIGYDVWARRPVLNRWEKASLIAHAWLRQNAARLLPRRRSA